MSNTMYMVMKVQQPMNSTENDDLAGYAPVYNSKEKANEIAGEKYRVWPVSVNDDGGDNNE